MALMPSLHATIILGLSLVVASGLYSTLSALVQCPFIGKAPKPDKLMEHFSNPEIYPNAKDDVVPVAYSPNTIFQLEKPIRVLKPSVLNDSDLIGKSCRFIPESREWNCRDCGLDGEHNDWMNCPILKRKRMCGDLTNSKDWDRPQPRKYTYMDPLSTETRSIITHYIDSPKHYEQIACERIEECWDFSNCPADTPMKVYVHHNGIGKSKAKRYVDLASERYPGVVKRVLDPAEACMLVVACDAYQNIDELQKSSLWNEGRNHFIWEANICFKTHADRPFDYPVGVHYARAALETPSLMDANIRKGYDVALAYTKLFIISEETYSQVLDTMGQQRHWLVAFKGNVYNHWPHVWWAHRWMAAEYWPKDDPEVAIDVTCDIKQNYTAEYDYLSLLMNSTFVFCPGGAATQSFRFTEALGLGAIPVTTPDLLPPFAYDLDWSGCVVHVSAARIPDLPRILRQIPRDEIVQRQQRCHVLFQKTVGWIPNPGDASVWKIDTDRTLFMTSMKVWASRIKKYHEAKKAKQDFENSLFDVSKDRVLGE